ncbi:hypothetical protein CR513_24089, partial [Mucuna pruriens]
MVISWSKRENFSLDILLCMKKQVRIYSCKLFIEQTPRVVSFGINPNSQLETGWAKKLKEKVLTNLRIYANRHKFGLNYKFPERKKHKLLEKKNGVAFEGEKGPSMEARLDNQHSLLTIRTSVATPGHSWHRHTATIGFHVFLLFLPLFLIFIAITVSKYGSRLVIPPPPSFFGGIRVRTEAGGFPWGVAALVLLLLVLASYLSNFRSMWSPLIWRPY